MLFIKWKFEKIRIFVNFLMFVGPFARRYGKQRSPTCDILVPFLYYLC